MGYSEREKAVLRRGGQKLMQEAASAEIYDTKGSKRERSTAAGQSTKVRQLLSPHLDLSRAERAAGNCFGAYFEQTHAGPGREFLREYVDGGGGGSGGVSESTIYKAAMVACAVAALKNAPAIIYPQGRSRGSMKNGAHKPIRQIDLVEHVCVHGYTLTAIALNYGWTSHRAQKARKGAETRYKLVVPDRQRKALAEALRQSLTLIGDVWVEKGYVVPYAFGTIEIE